MYRIKQKINYLLKRINFFDKYMRALTDSDLQNYSDILRNKISKNTDESEIIILAFSVIREADRRVLGMFPTDEQVLGALSLYFGYTTEIKTGEGKSLVATMPLFLKSLYYQPVFLVTINDYLASRDYSRIGQVYEWLNIKVSNGSQLTDIDLDKEEVLAIKKQIYSAHIIYISSSTLGFDYLTSNLSENKSEVFMPNLNFALLDEVDSILLDNAQSPLNISGPGKEQSNYFEISDRLVLTLQEDIHYVLDKESREVWLTELGLKWCEKFLSVEGILEKQFFLILKHINLALKAHHSYEIDRDYIIKNGEIILLDEKSGRLVHKSSLQNGLHQALQAKEGVEITPTLKVVSSITFQNLFRKFKEIVGMSGSVKVANQELISVYNTPVFKIKSSKKTIRIDHRSKSFVTYKAKISAIVKQVQELHRKERPILLISESIDTCMLLSLALLELEISHNILTAKHISEESRIIEKAGNPGMITIATSVAGRGTDIKLSEKSKNNGGLAVIITERLFSKRNEIQSRGRAGRQGEPGDSYVFESLEDQVVSKYVKGTIQKFYYENYNSDEEIHKNSIKKIFKRAQFLAEENSYHQRVNALLFDEVIQIQKNQFDLVRDSILSIFEVDDALLIINQCLERTLKDFCSVSRTPLEIWRFILDNINYDIEYQEIIDLSISDKEHIDIIKEIFDNNLERKRQFFKKDNDFLNFLKISLLKSLDVFWSKQIEDLNEIKSVIYPRTFGQNKEIHEFDKESKKSYTKNKKALEKDVLKNVGLSLLYIKNDELIMTFP